MTTIDPRNAPKNILFDLNQEFLEKFKTPLFPESKTNYWKQANNTFLTFESAGALQSDEAVPDNYKTSSENGQRTPQAFRSYSQAGREFFQKLLGVSKDTTALRTEIQKFIKNNSLDWETAEGNVDYNPKTLEDEIFNKVKSLGDIAAKAQQKSFVNLITANNVNPDETSAAKFNKFIDSEELHKSREQATNKKLNTIIGQIVVQQNEFIAALMKGSNADFSELEKLSSQLAEIKADSETPLTTDDQKKARYWLDRISILRSEVKALQKGPGMIAGLLSMVGVQPSPPTLNHMAYMLKEHSYAELSTENTKPSTDAFFLFRKEFWWTGWSNWDRAGLAILVTEGVKYFVPQRYKRYMPALSTVYRYFKPARVGGSGNTNTQLATIVRDHQGNALPLPANQPGLLAGIWQSFAGRTTIQKIQEADRAKYHMYQAGGFTQQQIDAEVNLIMNPTWGRWAKDNALMVTMALAPLITWAYGAITGKKDEPEGKTDESKPKLTPEEKTAADKARAELEAMKSNPQWANFPAQNKKVIEDLLSIKDDAEFYTAYKELEKQMQEKK